MLRVLGPTSSSRAVEGEQVGEGFNQLVDGAFTELGIGGVGHLAGGFEDRAESAFGGEGEAIVSGFAVDEEAAAFGC